MKNKKIMLILSIIVILVLTLGLTYALTKYVKFSSNNISITGDIYMKLNGGNQINLTNMYPMTKEEALKLDNNSFNFTITGKNTSNKTIYYGISLESSGTIKDSDISVYLEENNNVLVDGLRFQSFKDNPIYIDTIVGNTKEEFTKNYTLRVWLRENVLISDTESNADYTTDEWANSSISLKLKVDGDLNYKQVPLKIDTNTTYVENNKSYFLATIFNYLNTSEEGELLDTIDKMNLTINNTNNNVLFTYKDSLGNVNNTKQENLNLSYDFNKKQSVQVKVFMESINDANQETDIIVKSTKNNEEVYTLVQKVKINGNNFCLNNGFTKLSDCLLTSEAFSSSVDEAKTLISNKGSVNLNDTAPSYAYVEDITTNVSDVYSISGYKFYFADSYEFNSTTGTFRLYNKDGSDVKEDVLSDIYKNYYTCSGGTVVDIFHCNEIYKINTTSVNGTTYTITNGDKMTYKVASSLKSEQGLYKTTDDFGSTYFFRGDVNNNNVYFGGFYWKVLRINGDGSIRLIYNGTTPNATGYATSINNTGYRYNTRYQDLTYVGYMYGENFSIEEVISKETIYEDFTVLMKYYFADSYEYDTLNKVYKLKMKDTSKEMAYGTMNEMKDKFSEYPYTCVLTSSAGTCQVLLKINRMNPNNESQVYANYISYPSVSYEAIRENTADSNAKKVIDNWYKTNIVDKNLSSYIADNYFCNDRSLASNNFGDGHNLVPATLFSPYKRLYSDSNKSATLTCEKMDKFSVSTNIGNGKLTYPIALITADELALSGIIYAVKNLNNFLEANVYYFTMSPSKNNTMAKIFGLGPNGVLYDWISVGSGFGIRPVINLNSNVSIKSGDGTMENPYKLS